MNRYGKYFVIYFPALLIGCQVLINLLFFIAPAFYNSAGFYLNTFFGTNIMFAAMLVVLTHKFPWCSISRWCAWTELAYGVIYLVFQDDGVYNISFQIVTGFLALLVTFRRYVKKFPRCKISLITAFYWGTISHGGSCEAGYKKMERLLNDQSHVNW